MTEYATATARSLTPAQAWLRDDVPRSLGWFTLATFVFRCDVLVLLGPLTLQLLLTRCVWVAFYVCILCVHSMYVFYVYIQCLYSTRYLCILFIYRMHHIIRISFMSVEWICDAHACVICMFGCMDAWTDIMLPFFQIFRETQWLP